MAPCLHTFLGNFLELGQLHRKKKIETDRSPSCERVIIQHIVNALGLKLLHTQQSDQALNFLLFG